MSEKHTPPSKTPRTPAAVLLSTAALLVVTISFVVLKKSVNAPDSRSGNPESAQPESAKTDSATLESAPLASAQTQTAQTESARTEATKQESSPTSTGTSTATTANEVSSSVTQAPPAECWEGKFALKTARLSAVQKESLGERSQKIHLAEMLEKLSVKKINEAQLCVRAAGHAVAFEKDTKDPASILVRGGSGRIHEKAALQISYCLKAEKCSPCKIKKDSFEDALLGESEADAQANADEDVTGKLSAEVRRELARLEADSKPSAIDAWELQASSTRCGRG